jgi:broad specificity phosphatase PhoE
MTAMPRRTETPESIQLGLFYQGQPDVELSPTMRRQLAALIEGLMIEIAAALATGEAVDDQDHR